MTFLDTIKVKYSYTTNSRIALDLLKNLPELFAADFETAPKYTDTDKALAKLRLQNKGSLDYNRILDANGFSHPRDTVITHLSIAWSKSEAFVIICKDDKIRQLIYNFLTTTTKTQLWHNAVFDFSHIYFHTKGKLPISFIDTQLLARSLINNVDTFKCRTGLKDLMGYCYGDWKIAKENFSLEKQMDPKVIEYSAIDACATYKLYHDIMEDLDA